MLDRTAQLDLGIWGAGITGLTLGLLQARSGRKVAVIDPILPLGQQEGLPAGVLTMNQELQYHHITRWRSAAAAATYAEQNRRGIEFVLGEAAEAAVAIERMPMATYTADGHEAFWLRYEARAMRASGLEPEFDDAPALKYDIRPELVLEDQAIIDLVAYRDHLAQSFTDAGGILETKPVPARTLVSTTAYPPVKDHLGLRHRVDLATWNWLRVEVDELPDRIRFDLDENGRLLVPWQGQLLVGSRRDSGVEWVDAHLPGAKIVGHWQAKAAASLEALPLVGVNGSPDLLAATGFDVWELSAGTAGALQLHDHLTGTGVGQLPWSPIRFPRASAVFRAVWGRTRYQLDLNRITPFPKRG